MALKTIMLRRSIEKKQAELEALRQKDAEFSTREAELETAINEAETAEQEQAVTEEVETFDADKTAHEAKKAALAGEIEGLEAELSEAEAAAPTRSKENHLTKERTERKMETNINIRALPMSRRAFDALPMEQRSEIVAREDVREFFCAVAQHEGPAARRIRRGAHDPGRVSPQYSGENLTIHKTAEPSTYTQTQQRGAPDPPSPVRCRKRCGRRCAARSTS